MRPCGSKVLIKFLDGVGLPLEASKAHHLPVALGPELAQDRLRKSLSTLRAQSKLGNGRGQALKLGSHLLSTFAS